MTTADLISYLQQFDGDLPVYLSMDHLVWTGDSPAGDFVLLDRAFED